MPSSSALQALKGFTQSTGLHGYSYTTSGRNRLEAAFWTLICCVAVVLSALVINRAWKDWNANPVVNE